MIGTIISSFITIITIFYIWNNWSEIKLNWKEKRVWMILILTTLISIFNYFNTNQLIKTIIITLIFIIVYKFLFRVQLRQSIAGPLISQILYFTIETIFIIVMISIFGNSVQDFVSNYFGSFVANTTISIGVLFVSKLKIIKKLYNFFESIILKLDETIVIFLSIMVVFLFNIFTLNALAILSPEMLMIISLSISIISFVLICMFFKAKDDYYKMNDKYNSSLESLKELENALTNHRIDNHENRNHLMTIRNMTTSKKIIKFIDTILNNKLKDDKNISKETDIIPAGGLRGLVYSKLLLMNSKEIEYELDVASSVRLVDILDYGNDTMLDICKIVGIFLDNAIEEVETIEDKYIVIEMYLEEDVLTITITNTFDNTKCKDNIYKAGISTKGGNHGYGLSLVKKLVHNNKKLKTYHEINDSEFTQVLKIYK